jgi:hypothetical protein
MILLVFPMPLALTAEPNEYGIMLSAKISESPARVRLEWPGKPTPFARGYKVYRKNKGAAFWGVEIATLGSKATFFEDTRVAVGKAYEYKVANEGNRGYGGYIHVGIKVPPVEKRGKVVLLIEAEQAAALRAELETLKKDLIGDGWTVLRHDVSRNATPQSVQDLIRADYNADRIHLKAVFILGHIPVFKSGNFAPDGHELRPWPADAYYGTMTASWEGSPSTIPGEVQLQVGRVDFDDMPAFQKNATELLRQYLNKNHKYRTGRMATTKDAFVSDGFGRDHNYSISNGYKLFPTLWGSRARIDDGSWARLLSRNTYTWGHINGPGGHASCASVGGALTTSHLATQNYGVIFWQPFGSYFGEWDSQNNLMRALLAMPDYGLASAWTGRPNWFFHHMALGETIGYSTRLTQNNEGYNKGIYAETGMAPNHVHIALMGDPTLRMFPVLPATNLRVNNVPDGTQLQWDASRDRAVTGYYVYGAASADGPYRRLGFVSGTRWKHVNPGTTRHYMVRASKLTATGSGSFHNLSQGAMAVQGKALR